MLVFDQLYLETLNWNRHFTYCYNNKVKN